MGRHWITFCPDGVFGIRYHLQRYHRGYPLKLFGLLNIGATAAAALARVILADPECMKDQFTNLFLHKYPTAAALTSPASLATLTLLAIILHLDTADIECRNGWLRRHIRSKGNTWAPEASRISGDFLLMRCRQMLREHWSARHSSTSLGGAKAKPKPKYWKRPGLSQLKQHKRRPKSYRRAGGPCRAFLSQEWYKGNRDWVAYPYILCLMVG